MSGLDGMDGLDGLSYTAVTPRASLQSDANKIEIELETGTSLYFIAYC